MGLDQYAFARMTGGEPKEVVRWRKHNRLQGWMENLWRERGEQGGADFNCVDLELGTEDIDNLESAINNKELPETAGFFFGSDSYDEEYEEHYKQKDLDFIAAARKHLAEGFTVSYTCWW